MSTLRDVSLELARMEREMKKKEEEYNKQKANPEFCEKIMQFTKEDVRAIAGCVIKNFDTIVQGAKPELDDVRVKREKRTAKRKEAQRLKEQEVEAARQA